jgi:hypothetical protein
MRLAWGSLWLGSLAALCACSEVQIVENTPIAVTVRYGGVTQTLEAATAAAQTACAAHGKTARLRGTEEKGALERFAYFTCVGS